MIAITGAAGFIGSNLAQRLKGQAHLLLVDHPLTQAKLVNWDGMDRFSFLTHNEFLRRLEEGPALKTGAGDGIEAIFHLGACSRTTERDWDFLLRNNVEYSQRLWNWCTQNECPLIYASSAATYGDGSQGFDDRIHPADLKPLNLYGRSKNDYDLWVLGEADRGATPPNWAGVKFFNVYGPREAHKREMASVVWQAYRQATGRGWVGLFKSNDAAIRDGEQRRDFVYVEDCIDHLIWLWKNPTGGGLYNSGVGKARTFYDLASAVFKALDRKPDIRLIDMPADISNQYQNYTQAETTKLKEAGFDGEPTSLEAGVQKTVKAYLTVK